jgi:hypothetical protein
MCLHRRAHAEPPGLAKQFAAVCHRLPMRILSAGRPGGDRRANLLPFPSRRERFLPAFLAPKVQYFRAHTRYLNDIVAPRPRPEKNSGLPERKPVAFLTQINVSPRYSS